VSGELTYGLERIAMYLQDVDNVYDLEYGAGVRYGELYKRAEWEWSTYNFEEAPTAEYFAAFDHFEAEVKRLLQRGAVEQEAKKGKKKLVLDTQKALVLPAYDCLIKAAHRFNVLDARSAIGVTERQRFIGRVRALARMVAEAWLAQREAQGYPLLASAKAAQ
jgi:glycyl-tRNA synthetase alpha chain